MRCALLVLAILTTSATPSWGLNCVCPFFNLGGTGGSTYQYYAWKHTGATCYQKTLVIHEDIFGQEAACIPLDNCGACIQLGGTDVGEANPQDTSACCGGESEDKITQSPNVTDETDKTQPVNFFDDDETDRSFLQTQIPVSPDFDYDPKADGVRRTGTSKLMGSPFFLKVCTDQDCTAPKYLKVFMYKYVHQYPNLPEKSCSFIALGFESNPPGGGATVHRLLGGVNPVSVHLPDGSIKAPSGTLIEVTFGVTKFLAKVSNASDWVAN